MSYADRFPFDPLNRLRGHRPERQPSRAFTVRALRATRRSVEGHKADHDWKATQRTIEKRQDLAWDICRAVLRLNGVTRRPDEIQDALAFAGRVDITYWPSKRRFDVHWHSDPSGDSLAVTLYEGPEPTR
jgi:hypothetical protein